MCHFKNIQMHLLLAILWCSLEKLADLANDTVMIFHVLLKQYNADTLAILRVGFAIIEFA